jgi:hypothetical protein
MLQRVDYNILSIPAPVLAYGINAPEFAATSVLTICPMNSGGMGWGGATVATDGRCITGQQVFNTSATGRSISPQYAR